MSFLFKKVAAQDVITDYGRELKDKIGSSNYPRKAKIENGNRGRFTIYFPDGKFVDKFFHSYEEANKWCVSNGISVSDECESAQDAGNEEIFMKSHVRLFNEAKEKGDAKFLDWLKRSWNAAKVKPNYKAMSNNPSYRELDKLASDEVANDSAAMDDLNDGIKTIENKARALIADAKNARSKYADILARSEIAKNNAQVKKTFEDDIARCDKLINALKAI